MGKTVDFTQCKQVINKYGGADTKKTIIYNDKYYLLKFPNNSPKQNKKASYSNNVFSEYLGCHVFNTIGIKAQNTILGIYQLETEKIKYVCACEDFTREGLRLVEFQNLKNSFPETASSSNGTTTALEEIEEIIEKHNDIKNRKEMQNYFWNMFIIDALIGNYDRHNGNWGVLVKDETQEMKMAPIYDCGSCLYSQLTDEQMKEILNSETEINNRVYNRPTSAITENGKRINYYEFIYSLKNTACNEALVRIIDKIEMKRILKEVDEMPMISAVRKEFYKTPLNRRYEKILKKSYEKLMKNNGNK